MALQFVSGYIISLRLRWQTAPVLGFEGSEWLQCLITFLACWWYQSTATAHQWHQSTAFQFVSGCYALLYFKPAPDIFPGLFSQWALAVSHWVSSLLTTPVLGSSVCEWLSCLTVFKFAYNVYSHVLSLWVAAMLYYISSLLKTLLLAL